MKSRKPLLTTFFLILLIAMIPAAGTAVDDTISPRYALASGWIEVICTTDSSKSFSGKCFQCTKCYMVIATENEPAAGIGKYAEYGYGEKIGNFNYMRVSTVKHTTSTTLPAYRFRYI